MVILVVGRFEAEGFALHIAETLERMGHGVTRADMGFPQRPVSPSLWKRVEQIGTVLYEAAMRVPALATRQTRRLVATALKARPDLTIVCHDFLLPDQVAALKRATGGPVVLWFPDSIWSFGRAMFLNAAYDHLFFKDPYIVQRLRTDLGKNVFYLPECSNPQRHNLVTLSEQDRARFGCEITTAGNLYPYRVAFFEQLAGLDIKIWGNPPPLWMNSVGIAPMIQRRYVANQEKAKAFLAAKVVVNNLHAGEIWGVNVRCFEIAAVGAFQLISWRPALSQLFDDGSELVSFSTVADLREKLDYYLAADAERARIAAAGRARALRDHTYEHRLALLLSTVSGGARGYPLPEIQMRPASHRRD